MKEDREKSEKKRKGEGARKRGRKGVRKSR